MKMPAKIQERVLNAPQDVQHLGRSFWDAIQNLPGDISNESLELWRRSMGVGPRDAPGMVPKEPPFNPEGTPGALPLAP